LIVPDMEAPRKIASATTANCRSALIENLDCRRDETPPRRGREGFSASAATTGTAHWPKNPPDPVRRVAAFIALGGAQAERGKVENYEKTCGDHFF
jgi:hypothetical protein